MANRAIIFLSLAGTVKNAVSLPSLRDMSEADPSPSLRGMSEAIQIFTGLLRAYLAMTREWIALAYNLAAAEELIARFIV